MKYFSTLEDKFRISARPCNILYVFAARWEELALASHIEYIRVLGGSREATKLNTKI